MKDPKEKRRFIRHKTFWTIVTKDDNNQDIDLGFLLNISETGLNVWINQDQKLTSDSFVIWLYPPENEQFDPIEIKVRSIWTKTHEQKSLIEMGCEFIDITNEHKFIINQLIKQNKNFVLRGAIMIDN
ncbi:MAG: PilZ domain-containing protein [Spirochaetota bacterium]|nr:PilZ domain-containing protein [Spirochaetota bacterium]